MQLKVRFRELESSSGLEAERQFDVPEWHMLLSRIERVLRVTMARALESYELTVTEWVVLSAVADKKGGDEYTNTKVAEAFDMNVSQATNLISGLVKHGHLKQKVSAKDRRVKFLTCTRSGKRLAYDSNQAMQRAMRYWLFDLSDNEIEQFTSTIKKILTFELPVSIS